MDKRHFDFTGTWENVKVIDLSPKPSAEFMSDAVAGMLAATVCASLPKEHPFNALTVDERAEVCRAAHFFASLRG